MVGYRPNPSDKSTWRPANRVWDFEEHTIMGDGWYHGNTTRVDAYGCPMSYRLHCTDGFDTCRGELPYVYYQSRQSFFDEFENEVPYEFSKLGTMQALYKIPNPGTTGSDIGPGGKYASYPDKYCSAFGVSQTPYLNGITSANTEGAVARHVLGMTDAQQADSKYHYKAAPCDFYAYFLHRRAYDFKCYGFPYDDSWNWSSFIEHGNVSWFELAVGY